MPHSRTGKRCGQVLAITLVLVVAFAIPALATTESGFKSCSSDAHVYTKGVWKSYWYSWVDIEGDGIRENFYSDTNGGVWETDYLNAYGWPGGVDQSVNSAYYKIYGTVLDTWSSWPGCQAD
jgi:hypothetical protein